MTKKHLSVFLNMDTKNKLRNNLVRKIQLLSIDKLTQLDAMFSEIGKQFVSKEKTLQLAGSWNDLDEDVFTKLNHNRVNNSRVIFAFEN